MRMCELRQKEVINICDGMRLGYPDDIEFDLCTGRIQKIIIPGPCKIWGMLGRDHEYVIDFCDIRQVGADVILVEVDVEKIFVKCKV
ncbi:YlmC/YmxH family sporulation protein [Velocimicrobium porci]|uniref:YlmC/YmxH family sporulation protein n=1 Tax=Velocimicrobium porci TaxID=2606634 RepID=A0A6L5XW20_9FIRM|nr:YlmC/YmxH family sporulation protein [Velocimicrobium porci]MSS63026.1 YlmC/YmxH family sporulation protein [Velocimicrobium porci]